MNEVELQSKKYVRQSRQSAWEKYIAPIKQQVIRSVEAMHDLVNKGFDHNDEIKKIAAALLANREPQRREVLKSLHSVLTAAGNIPEKKTLADLYHELSKEGYTYYGSHLYDESPKSPLNVRGTELEYSHDSPLLNGFEILNRYFDELFQSNPKVIAFGEDVGKIGDVNQGFAGLQTKFGEHRIFDTGIRELTIVGQAIGLAIRGLKPIAEIQYLDYLLYGLQPLSDDAASLHWRTAGRQSCPLIIRTRGHRLEGIWHSGSPMGLMVHSLRGFHICVPRNMVQAAGMYNTVLQGNDPAIVVESLNGYRLKEKLPRNLIDYRVPLGIPEIIKEGNDISIVSYGSVLRIIQEASAVLEAEGISCEIIDVQTLLPFDINHSILASLKKTNRIVFIDEDVPGGAAGYMFNKIMEEQGGYRWLDVSPRTITGKAHRPSYGSDGDYFSKPNTEEIIDVIREMLAE